MADSSFALNARVVRPVARYVRDKVGPEAQAKLAAAAGVDVAEIGGQTHWIPVDRMEAMLEIARSYVPDDDAFRRVCTYRIDEGYGALRFIVWATSPRLVYLKTLQAFNVVSTFGHCEILQDSRTFLRVRYTSPHPEKRLQCLLRTSQIAEIPTLCGLPPANVREESCISRGDDSCTYHLRWFDRRSWWPSLAGIGLGSLSFSQLSTFSHAPWVTGVALSALGAALGWLWETQRTTRVNVEVQNEITEGARQLAREEAEARREILDLHQRQRDWTRVFEEEARERAQMLQRVTSRLQSLQEQRDTKILGFSHDLRNPLSVLQGASEFLADHIDELGEEGPTIVADLEDSIDQMRRLLDELMGLATKRQNKPAPAVPQAIVVDGLVGKLRRRLSALVQGKDIRANVFRTREAPESFEADLLVFDRVLDNLLTNAAKYTERGNISVEIDGTPDTLTIKVADTGRGIAGHELQRVFEPQGSERSERAKNSYGVGLSVVVQLLGQIGGKLEVMSRLGAGTTFWVQFPLRARMATVPPTPKDSEPPTTHNEVVSRVVTIRRPAVETPSASTTS